MQQKDERIEADEEEKERERERGREEDAQNEESAWS